MKRTVILSGVAALSGACVAQADVHPFLTDRFILQAGTFFSDSSLSGSVNGGTGGDNPEFDFQDQFGVSKSKNLGAGEFSWRFTQNWSAHLQYFNPDQTGTAVLLEDVSFGDAVFEQGSSVSASSETEVIRLFFGRDFSKREDMSYGIGAGLHRLEIGFGLTGNVIVNGQPLINETRAVGSSAPLPNIGGWYSWSPAPKWELSARVDWLEASIEEYEGGLLNAALGANYQLFKHLGIGAKYQTFRVNLDVDKPRWQGGVELEWEGAYVYLSGNWN